ncbi:MAG: ECF-type sigma factor [Planctomycetota bacterium]
MERRLDLTLILRAIAAGDIEARRELVQAVYPDLCRLAIGKLKSHRDDALTPLELVHEIAIRILGESKLPTHSRSQFFAYVSRMMRNILVDRLRSRKSIKRQGEASLLTLNDHQPVEDRSQPDFRSVHEALAALGQVAPRQARIVHLRYFHGLSNQEVAMVFGVSRATVKRDLELARRWLREWLVDET